MSDAGLVSYHRDGHVVTLRLDDPARRNGLSPEMVDALIGALERTQADPDARCVVLTGAGTAFSAGGDPKRMLDPELYPAFSTAETRRFYRRGIQRLPLALAALEIPIIAAVNGPAIGAGCDLACFCDVRIASDAARFATSFVKLGLVPGDGGAWILPRVIGRSAAAEMLLGGDPIDAATALRLGLVSAVTTADELLPEAYRRAQRIAANPPHAVQLTKRLIAECERVELAAALELSAAMQSICHKMEDHREAVRAALDKRAATFTGK